MSHEDTGVHLGLRIGRDLMKEIDEIAEEMQRAQKTHSVSRSDAVRTLLVEAILRRKKRSRPPPRE
jgi:metal-responsive CopG/Arc/MetJ family transcriptional regulator